MKKTFSRVKAIPSDIKIRKIVAYISKNVVFSTNTGSQYRNKVIYRYNDV